MTIFFSGQINTFKYEVEGIAKLFFPVIRFNHVYDSSYCENRGKLNEDYIFTRVKRLRSRYLLWVKVKLSGSREQRLAESAYLNIASSNNELEIALCQLVYKALNKLTGIRPKWGILTGIRPVATIQKLRRNGMTDSEISSHLKSRFHVSDEKLTLAFLTADVQLDFLKEAAYKSYSLYIAIPFCPSRCSYCSFVSQAITDRKALEKVDEYVELLCKELEYTSRLADEIGLRLETVYIGGGTPTALSAEQLKKVTLAVARCFDLSAITEYTIEAGRADTITREKLEIIKAAGANRISVNPQTFNDDVLSAIGRRHTAGQVDESFKLAREVGFDVINMDLIAGLPTDTVEGFKYSLDHALELSPENITVHTLSIKRSSELFDGIEQLANNIIEQRRGAETAQMTEYAQQKLIKSKYLPYYLYRQKNTVGNLENVGYSKQGFESLYNIYIMDEIQTILACGAGGTTKLVRKCQALNNGDSKDTSRKLSKSEMPIQRIFNYKYHFEYISGFDEVIKRKGEVKRFYDY